jgi:predicted ArsR family transcriptional regulator
MDTQGLLAPDAGPPIGESRARALDLLRAAGGPLGVQDAAEQAGLHANTARFHLDALVDADLAAREPLPRESPGRPSMVYRVTGTDGPTGQRRHRCPFREVAERHQDVVCALHLGLMQGVLDQIRVPVTADRLQPFAEPSVCVAELSTGAAQPAPTATQRKTRARARR